MSYPVSLSHSIKRGPFLSLLVVVKGLTILRHMQYPCGVQKPPVSQPQFDFLHTVSTSSFIIQLANLMFYLLVRQRGG